MYIVDYYTRNTPNGHWVRKKERFEQISQAYAFILLMDEADNPDPVQRFISMIYIW